MAFFRKSKIINYQRKEIEKLEKNLQKLSRGDFDLDWEVSAGDSCVEGERILFVKLNQHILKIKGKIDNLTADAFDMNSNMQDGNIGYQIDPTEYSGAYSSIVKDINAGLAAIREPFNSIYNVLEKMAVNDYTVTVDTDLKGDFGKLANTVNDVQKRLLAVQNVAVKISQGDISELENFRKIGRRSENDHILPALTHMMEAIQDLIDATARFSEAAEEGNLDVRGDTGKFKG